MQDLNIIRMFMNAIIDQDWCVDQLTDARSPFNQTSDIRKSLQQIDMIQDSVSESLGCGRKIHP